MNNASMRRGFALAAAANAKSLATAPHAFAQSPTSTRFADREVMYPVETYPNKWSAYLG